MKHTPEPWKLTDDGYATAGEKYVHEPNNFGFECREGDIIPDEVMANARRIVACVNACQGIPTEALEAGVVRELVTAATAIDRVLQETSLPGPSYVSIAERHALKVALAKLEKEAQP